MVNNIIEITAKRVRGHKARPGKTTGSHINGRTAKGAQSPLGSDINKWIDSVRQYKEIMTMNDKEFRKLMKGINDAHSVLEAYQEQVLSHASSIVSKIEKNNQNKDEEALESLRLIKDQLRQVQFTDDKEFESEQLITRIDRITKNTTKGNNARIDNEWDKYFELLEDYMKEKGHCYFEPPKKNKNGKLIYQNYKGEKLGEWVDNIRKGRNKLDGEKLTKLVNLAVDQRYIIKLARNHEIIVDILRAESI